MERNRASFESFPFVLFRSIDQDFIIEIKILWLCGKRRANLENFENISWRISRDFENRILQVFIESLFTIVSRELFFSYLKNDFFFFFQKFLVPVQPVRQHSIDHRSFVGDIAAPSCERRRAYTSLISEGHTAHCRRNKAFRTVALLYWSDFLSLSLFFSASFARHSFS